MLALAPAVSGFGEGFLDLLGFNVERLEVVKKPPFDATSWHYLCIHHAVPSSCTSHLVTYIRTPFFCKIWTKATWSGRGAEAWSSNSFQPQAPANLAHLRSHAFQKLQHQVRAAGMVLSTQASMAEI